jgi:hypothetical protein
MRQLIARTLGSLLLVTAALPTLADHAPKRPSFTQASPGIHGLEQAQQRADGTLVASGRVSGSGHIHAPHLVIEGELSPGNSPGCITFGGDVTFSFSATLVTEIGGLTPCTEHDQIDVANQLTINSATLEVVLINGFMPAFGDSFDIMDWDSITGSFGTIDTSAASLPAPLTWDTSQLHVTGELVVDVVHYMDGDLAPWENPDGLINAADVVIASQLVVGRRTPGALQYAHGDMDGNGVINVADQLLITKAVLGL